MIVYIPRLIETAEQAEALPEGTIITHAEYHPQEKFAGLWGRNRNTNRQLAQQDGWTALVPIEAEEETVARGNEWQIPTENGRMPNGDPIPDGWSAHTRLVTPWEAASTGELAPERLAIPQQTRYVTPWRTQD